MASKDDFIASLSCNTPSSNLSPALQALWYDKKGDWEKAHELVQDGKDSEECVVHAYLHRKEGDISNGRYWYRLSGRKEFIGSLDEEWEALVRELLL